MKVRVVAPVGAVLLEAAAMLAVLTACGGAARPVATAGVPGASEQLSAPIPTATHTPLAERTFAPAVAAAPTPEPTTAPSPTRAPSPGSVAAPEYCVAPEQGPPQDIVDTPASPYFVRQPRLDNPFAPIIVFLGGGDGTRRGSQRLWANYLSGGRGVDEFRIVLPYSEGVEFYDASEMQRTFTVVDEVLACYGGDSLQVHLAGFSNGGYVAYELMLQRPERFATLLGAPGLFRQQTPAERIAEALRGKAVFNGVGSRDDEWKPLVQATDRELQELGIDSVYVEFADQGHSLAESFDETVFFDFWRAHAGR